jgi:two-component system heavy metal sensor histidine kinase CusS
MLDRLEDAFTRLSQCAADLAHELRTPINNLRGEAEVALSRCRTTAEYQEVLQSSLEEFERLSRMIDGLLFIARADNPCTAVERVRFDARQEIEAVREFYEALSGERGVEVACEGQADLSADPLMFRRAVGNLLANALRHTRAGGRVRLTVRPSGEGGIELQVQDNGGGITPADLPRVFDRFFRADSARASKERGTGLGLPIVQSIMRVHGGTAHVRSAAGEGTTVTLQFPPVPAGDHPSKMTDL